MRSKWRTGVMAMTLASGLLATGFPVLSERSGAARRPIISSAESSVTLLATLNDPSGVGHNFGSSVAISGTTAIVGASDQPSGDGAAYIYTKGTTGWPSAPNVTLNDPGATSGDDFGSSVAISGATAVVGADGAAYIYTEGPGGWPTSPNVTLAPTSDKTFYSVTISGSTAIVGVAHAGAAFVYTEGPGGWSSTPSVTLNGPTLSGFGWSVAVKRTTAIIGADTYFKGGVDGGAAFIYTEDADRWHKVRTLVDPTASAGAEDFFGFSVAIRRNVAIVGAERSGTTHLGVGYIYTKGTTGWPSTPSVTLNDPGTASNDNFGTSVAISGSAETVFVGASNANDSGGVYTGTVSMYTKGTSGWPSTPSVTLNDPGVGATAGFGNSIAVSGTTAIVGAAGGGYGWAFLYQI